jgi:hypothetical protein
MKKTRDEKSRDTVPLKRHLTGLYLPQNVIAVLARAQVETNDAGLNKLFRTPCLWASEVFKQLTLKPS